MSGGRIAGGGADDRQRRFRRKRADQEHIARPGGQAGDPPEHKLPQRVGHFERIVQGWRDSGLRRRGQFQRERGFPPEASCRRSSSDRPGDSDVRVASSSRIAPRLSGPSRRRSTLPAGTLSVASRGGIPDQSVRTAASRPTGSNRRRRSANDRARAEALSSHARSSTTITTGCVPDRVRSNVSTAVAVVRGSAEPLHRVSAKNRLTDCLPLRTR